MSTVEGGIIRQLSVSQAEQFDHVQVGGCNLRWWLERVDGRRPPMDDAKTDGDVGHQLLAMHLRGEELPTRSRMLKAVRGAIAAGKLPAPGPHLLVETRFDSQPKNGPDGTYLPVDVTKTLWLGGVPWDGYVDLRYRRDDGTVYIVDHKFSSDIHQYAKLNDGLLPTVQMPVYALDSLRIWPDATHFVLAHHYVSRRGVDSFVRGQKVTRDQVHERTTQIERLVAQMQQVARATRQGDVPFNRRACDAWRGCPHQSICSAFKTRRAPMQLSPEEEALFGGADESQPAGAPPPAADDDLGDLFATPTPGVTHEFEPGQVPAGKVDVTERMRAAGHDVPPGEIVLADIPLPVASVPTAQPAPVCPDCGTELHPQNGSRLPSGVWKHVVGCPMASAAPAPAVPPAGATADTTQKRRGRPPGAKNKAPPTGGETCKDCGELGAQTLAASGLQVHNGCKGAKVDSRARPGESYAETYERACQDADPPDGETPPNPAPLAALDAARQSATAAPVPAETTATPKPDPSAQKLHEYMERRQAEDRRHAAEKWNSGGMDGDGPRVHPLAGTLRVELGLSPEFVALAERLIAVLVKR